jgi:glycosyltransferase involved in cell wall biosynthesis
MLVSPAAPQELAEALKVLLVDENRRRRLASALTDRIRRFYSAESSVRKLRDIYDLVMDRSV